MWPDDHTTQGGGNDHPEEELAAFALNALDGAEFQAVFHHVVQCPHCQEVLVGFQETSARLTASAPETPLPPGLKRRVLASAIGRTEPEPVTLPASDPRWSGRRLRRWLMPAAIGTLSLLLAVSVGVIALQQREIDRMTAAVALESEPAVVAASAPSPALAGVEAVAESVQQNPAHTEIRSAEAVAVESGTLGAAAAQLDGVLEAEPLEDARVGPESPADTEPLLADAKTVDRMKEEMAEVVEATVLSAQPETERVSMSSPMGTAPAARGVLMVEPNGRRGVLMVSGMPADSYQIWLVRGGHQVLVDRLVVNDDDGAGLKQLEMDESIFHYHQVALMPDERHGPTTPTGEQVLSALIIQGPPIPPK